MYKDSFKGTEKEFIKKVNEKIFNYFQVWDEYGIVQYCNAGTMAYPKEEIENDDRNVHISYLYRQNNKDLDRNVKFNTIINKVVKNLDNEFKNL